MFQKTTNVFFVNQEVGEADYSCDALFPIVYHPGYDIGFFGLERLHPFDTSKYSKVFKYLQANVPEQIQTYTPTEITDKELKRVHTPEYLEQLQEDSSNVMAQISELPSLAWLPNWITQSKIQKPMRLATGGTVLACELALQHGKAINLSGGYHHAKANSGGGFCAYADIPVALYKLLDCKKVKKVLVIDLDAHQGNGLELIFASDPRIDVFDVFNGSIYPYDLEAAHHITYKHPVSSFIQDSEYLELLTQELPKAIKESKPDLIVYNAGTDVYEGDPLGYMSLSAQGIKKRDMFVFETAEQFNIPIAMVLSGGYTKESALIISESLVDIIEANN